MIEKKRIAFLCHPYHRGGVTRWMADAAIALATKGHEIYFVTVNPVKEFFSGKGRDKMITLLNQATDSLTVLSKGVDHSFEFGTEEFRASIYADLVATGIPAGTPMIVSDDAAVWMAAAHTAHKYPMVGVIHGNDAIYYRNAAKYAKQLSACVCVSNELKNNLLSNCPAVNADIVTVIPCGINLPVFSPQGGSDEMLRLIFIGRISDAVKRASDLVLIAEALQKKGIRFHLQIVGNSEESAADFTKRFNDAGVLSCVTFNGWLAMPGIQRLLDRSDILLLTSNSEGMPIVMMEALASGCGFTGSRVGGIKDYEHHPLAVNCLSVFTAGNIDDAVGKINAVAAVPKEIRMSAARKLAESEFSMKVCLERYFNAIGRINGKLPEPLLMKFSLFEQLYSKVIAYARYLKVSLTAK